MTTTRHQFTDEATQRYGHWSGDRNPLHVDARAARRLLAGRQVVHGMHTVTLLLQHAFEQFGVLPATLRADFVHAIHVGDEAEFVALAGTEAPSRLVAQVDGLRCTEVTLDARAADDIVRGVDAGDGQPSHDAVASPLELDAAAVAGWVGHGGSLEVRAGAEMPAWGRLPPERAAALASLSRLVGMVCPGLHSVFAGVELAWGTAGERLRFRVERFDARFGQIVVAFDGAVRGRLRAFVRPAPRPQAAMATLLPRLRADAFAGQRALVVGGSRGLGELCAKLLAAGGAEVTLTYAHGEDDAQRVAAEITAAGRGSCRVRRFVVGQDAPSALADTLPLHAVAYFATSRIAKRPQPGLDAALLEGFMAVHVRGFESLVSWLAAAQPDRPVRWLYPSSVYVAERPRGMTEYAMAKAAAEVLVADLARQWRHHVFSCPRLPRLDTDQTAGLLPSGGGAGDNVAVLLPQVLEAFSEVPAPPAG